VRALAGRRLARAARRAGVLPVRPAVLMYHRVATEVVDPWGLAVSAGRFDEQLRWLTEHRDVLALPELARLHRESRLPAGAVAITFDDGYACNATVAAPLLHAHQACATVFVTTGPLTTGQEFWWDDLQRIVFDASVLRLDVALDDREESVELGDARGGEVRWGPGSPPRNARQHAFLHLWRALRSLEPPAQAAALTALRAQSGIPVTPRESHRPMTPAELQSLSRSGVVEIGCHTVTHPALTERSEGMQRAEIEEGRAACADMTGRLPTTFAYPFGDYGRRTVGLVREAGFEAGCTTDAEAVTPGHDVLALPRLRVLDWSAEELGRQLRAL
jgi:peptidoglycan/xylan/chitin deacetylase (PgdA/CDA1 family)